MGTWASAVTSAVAPLCWESKTFLTTVSGADSITQLPHQGYLIRTQPNNHLQVGKPREFIVSLERQARVRACRSRRRSRVPTQKRLAEVLPKGGSELVGALIYEKDKTTYRSEIDQALRTKPDFIYLNGYAPDVTVLLRDLYRAGYRRRAHGAVLCGEPARCSTRCRPRSPTAPTRRSPRPTSTRPAIAARRPSALGSRLDPDSYETPGDRLDQPASRSPSPRRREATGTAMRDNVRKISPGRGMKVYSAVEGLKALAEGKEINYEGASGPCDFTEIGDILDCKFRYQQVEPAPSSSSCKIDLEARRGRPRSRS